MDDFFVVSVGDILTTLRVIFNLVLWASLIFLLVIIIHIAIETCSFYRWAKATKLKPKNNSRFGLARASLDFVWNNYSTEIRRNFNYWRNSGDWRYYDSVKNKWVCSKNAKPPVFEEDEDC